MSKASDIAYLEGIKSNDSKVDHQIYIHYLPKVKHYILNNSGNVNDVFDVFQEAMIVIYQKIDSSSGLILSSTFEAYLLGVVRFIWLKQLKKRKKEVITNDFKEVFVEDTGWEDQLLDFRKKKLFKSKLSALPEKCRELLQLAFKKTAGKEIARKLGYTEDFVRRKKLRCKEALAKAIKSDKEYQLLAADNENILN